RRADPRYGHTGPAGRGARRIGLCGTAGAVPRRAGPSGRAGGGEPVGWPAPADRVGPGPAGRPTGAGAHRADDRGRRGHRTAHRPLGGRPALRAGHAGDQLQPGCVRSRRPGRAARGRWGRVRCTRRAGRDLSSLPGVGAAMIGTTPGDTGTTLPVAHAGTTARVVVRLLARRPGLLVLVVVSTVLAGVAGLVAPI